MEDLLRWIHKCRSGKIWMSKLKSKQTKQQFLYDFKRYCEATGKDPDELIQLKLEGQRLVGTMHIVLQPEDQDNPQENYGHKES